MRIKNAFLLIYAPRPLFEKTKKQNKKQNTLQQASARM